MIVCEQLNESDIHWWIEKMHWARCCWWNFCFGIVQIKHIKICTGRKQITFRNSFTILGLKYHGGRQSMLMLISKSWIIFSFHRWKNNLVDEEGIFQDNNVSHHRAKGKTLLQEQYRSRSIWKFMVKSFLNCPSEGSIL